MLPCLDIMTAFFLLFFKDQSELGQATKQVLYQVSISHRVYIIYLTVWENFDKVCKRAREGTYAYYILSWHPCLVYTISASFLAIFLLAPLRMTTPSTQIKYCANQKSRNTCHCCLPIYWSPPFFSLTFLSPCFVGPVVADCVGRYQVGIFILSVFALLLCLLWFFIIAIIFPAFHFLFLKLIKFVSSFAVLCVCVCSVLLPTYT